MLLFVLMFGFVGWVFRLRICFYGFGWFGLFVGCLVV